MIGATDIDRDRATARAGLFGGVAYPTLDDLLGDENVDIVLNLTFASAHFDVTASCLAAGKRVYSEKPLALTYRRPCA